MRKKLLDLIQDFKESGWQSGTGPINDLIYNLEALVEFGTIQELAEFSKTIKRHYEKTQA